MRGGADEGLLDEVGGREEGRYPVVKVVMGVEDGSGGIIFA